MKSKKFSLRRLIFMIIGNMILGVGIGIFKLSGFGNDPSSAMVMAVGEKLGIAFSVMLLIFNCLWFVIEIVFGRHLIGLGTFFNWFLVGIFADLFVNAVTSVTAIPTGLPARLLILVVGILVLSFACSLYQTADMGISPYDSHALLLSENLPVPYFWLRIGTDSLCTLVALAFGGLIGIGTLVCALGLGPFISFFNRAVSEKLIFGKNGKNKE